MASLAAILAMGYPVALLARAEERLTRGLISMAMISTLSGFSALPVAVAVSALAAAAELPASQIFPWLSAAIAVATSSLPESMVFDQRLVPAKSLA